MKDAQKTAEALGFGEELKQLCTQSQSVLDSTISNIEDGSFKFKDLKDKFTDKAI
jgi:hypothetical protein